MEPWLRAFLILLGGLALFVQPGPFLNDEVGQMAAVTSLAEGDLLVQSDLPGTYEVIRGWGGNVVPKAGADPRPNAGSTMTTILALPILGVLHLLEVPLGPMGAVGLLVAAAVGCGLWAWRGRPYLAGAAASALLLGSAIMQVRWTPPSSPYLEAAALQIVSLLFHAFASALIYDLLRTRVDRPAIATALYAFGTPALFWGLNLKYHSVAISLAAICIWLYQEGHRTKPLRTGLAFAVAGLAVWNHLPNGLLVLGSLGVMALPAVTLGLRPLAGRVAAGVAGLSLGVIIEACDRALHNALETRDRFIQVGGTGGGVQDVEQQLERQAEHGRLRWAAWNDTEGPFDAFWQMVVWVDRSTPQVGAALPMLALVPVIVLVVWAYRRQRMSPLMAWPIVHLLVMLVLFGRGVFQNGGGFDMRQGSTIWPFVIVAIAPIIQVRGRDVARMGAAIVAAMTVIVWIPLLIVRQRNGFSALVRGPTYDLVDPLRFVGVGVAVAILLVWLMPRLRPWRVHAVAGGVAWSVMVQVLLQLGPARSLGEGVSFPFVAWPVALLEWFSQWFLVRVW